MKAKEQNVPALRFPGFAGEWLLKKLGDTAKIKHGFAFKGENFSSSGKYIVLTPGNFDPKGGFRYQGEKEKYYASSDFPPEYILEKGDLLTVMTEQAVGLIGSTLIIPESGSFLHNQRLGLFQPMKIVARNFLFHYLKTTRLRIELSKTASGTKVRHTSPKKIESVKINIPSLPEQQKIASFLTAVDTKIEQLSKKKALLEQYKKGMMQKLFSQELRFKDEQGNDFPDWKKKRLGNLVEVINGLTYSPTDIRDEGLLVLRSSNVQQSQIQLTDNVFVNLDVANEKLVIAGDILLCVRNGSRRLIGKSAQIPTGIPKATHGAFMSVLRSEMNNFIFQLLQTPFFFKEVHKNLGATINSINGSDLKKFKFMLPAHPEEQRKIATFLSSIDQKINLVSTELEKARTFKKGLLQQMFV